MFNRKKKSRRVYRSQLEQYEFNNVQKVKLIISVSSFVILVISIFTGQFQVGMDKLFELVLSYFN